MQEIGKELSDIHKLAQRQIDVLNRRVSLKENGGGDGGGNGDNGENSNDTCAGDDRFIGRLGKLFVGIAKQIRINVFSRALYNL